MALAFFRWSEEQREAIRRRTLSVLLALLVELAVVLLLIAFQPRVPGSVVDDGLHTFDVAPAAPKAEKRESRKASSARSTASAAPPPDRPTAPSEAQKPKPPDALSLSHDEFAATDISKLGSAQGGDASASAKDSARPYGPGEGPNGEQLYNAEWYREPTRAELAFYIPPNLPEGWGMIACQTVANFHVDNCRQIGEFPPGSGISRGLRQAAWQFLVRPPRLGGKPIIGAWVRIRFDLVKGVTP